MNIADQFKRMANRLGTEDFDASIVKFNEVLEACRAGGINVKVEIDSNFARSAALTEDKHDMILSGRLTVGESALHFALQNKYSDSNLYLSALPIISLEGAKAGFQGFGLDLSPMQGGVVALPFTAEKGKPCRTDKLTEYIIDLAALDHVMTEKMSALRPAEISVALPEAKSIKAPRLDFPKR